MSKTAFITGITGMDGILLSNFLLDLNYDIIGLVRKQSSDKIKQHEKIKYIIGELGQIEEVLKKLDGKKIDEFYLLAGQTSIEPSWEDFSYTFDTNVNSLVNILEYVRKKNPSSKIFFASSSEIFGCPDVSPQTEKTEKKPRNPYGMSKHISQELVKFYREKHKIFACCGILYNHESEFRRRDVVTKKISSTVAKIYLGLESKLVLGNIKAKRDWSSAKDFVEGMWLSLQQPNADDYIFSSGISRQVNQMIKIAFECIGIYNYEQYILEDEKYFRPSEEIDLVGDSSKLKSIGWQPKISFEELIKDMVYNDIEKLKNKL